MNQLHSTLQLQVDIFSVDIADAVDRWVDTVTNDEAIQARIKELTVIHDGSNGFRF